MWALYNIVKFRRHFITFFLFVQYISYMRHVHIPKNKGVWKHTGKAGMQKHTRNKLKRVQHTKTTTATFNVCKRSKIHVQYISYMSMCTYQKIKACGSTPERRVCRSTPETNWGVSNTPRQQLQRLISERNNATIRFISLRFHEQKKLIFCNHATAC